MIKIDKQLVETVKWETDPDTFDVRLHRLGKDNDEFIVVNPSYDPWILDYVDPSGVDSDGCVVWAIDNLWLVKKFKKSWTESQVWQLVHCELDIEKTVEFNPDVKFITSQLQEQITNYKINIEDLNSEHVWHVDPSLVENDDKIWLARVRAVNADINAIKDMGYVLPPLTYNPDLPKIEYDIKFDIPYYHYDFNYELVWHLDDRFNHDSTSQHDYDNNKIWVAKFDPDISFGYKEMPPTSPVIEYNPDIADLDYDVYISFPYQDLVYEHVWYLDKKFNYESDTIWAFRIAPKDIFSSFGTKNMGYVQPKIEYNPDLPKIAYDISVSVPYQDLVYEHVWYLDKQFNHDSDMIWAFKITPRDSSGTKNMGYVQPKIEYNPDIPKIEYDIELSVPYQDLVYEHVWYLDKQFNYDPAMIWAFRIKPIDSIGTKNMGYVRPKIEFNPDLPAIEYDINISIPYQDLIYQHEWYLDPKFNFDNEKIWAFRISPDFPEGFKSQGYVSPKVEYNPAVPRVNYNFVPSVAYQDLVYEHVWYLDTKFNSSEDKVWVAKITPKNSKGVTDHGFVGPALEYNPDIPPIDYEFTLDLPYYDFDYNYELVWYLNPKFSAGIDHVWAIKLVSENNLGVKDMGYVSPRIIYNKDIPKLNYYITDEVPYYDLNYEHVWMLPDELHTDIEKIWAAKIVPAGSSLGVKQMGYVKVGLDNYDVVFISYNEPNAEANWQRVLELCPTAKRVKNVKGIFEAHKAAAELAETDMFYVVDGDAELVDNWRFDYRPNVFNMDCVHLWTSINPINDLEYGWGGVKLFPRKLLLDATSWKVDLTTGLGKLIYFDKVSNLNAFNTGPFNTWRSAFRECAKLSASLHQGTTITTDSEYRLRVWNTVGEDRPYGKYAIEGAKAGTTYGLENFNNIEKLKLINDYDWMKHEFNEFYKYQ